GETAVAFDAMPTELRRGETFARHRFHRVTVKGFDDSDGLLHKLKTGERNKSGRSPAQGILALANGLARVRMQARQDVTHTQIGEDHQQETDQRKVGAAPSRPA